MKKSKSFRIAIVLFILTMASCHVYSGTLAKYVTSASGSDTARVAKWGVTMSVSGNLFGKNYEPHSASSNKNEISLSASSQGSVYSSTGNIVAPGTQNSKGMTVRVSGTPEVASQLQISLEAEDVFLDAKNGGDGSQQYGIMCKVSNPVPANLSKYYVRNTNNGLVSFAKASSYETGTTYYELTNPMVLTKRADNYLTYFPIRWKLEIFKYDANGNEVQLYKYITNRCVNLSEALFLNLPILTGGTWGETSNEKLAVVANYAPNQPIDFGFRITWDWPIELKTSNYTEDGVEKTIDYTENDTEMANGADTILGKLAAAKKAGSEPRDWYVVTKYSGNSYIIPVEGAEDTDYNLTSAFEIDMVMTQID